MTNFTKKTKMVIINTEPYYDGLFGNNDLVSKVYVDLVVTDKASKTYVDQKIVRKILLLMTNYQRQ